MKGKYVSLICWLVLVHHGFAVPERIPPDVFKAQRDGYLYADYPGVFDDIEDGITIEAWIYLNEPPGDRERDLDRNGNWLIFGKPGSYFVNISGRNLDEERDHREGSAIISFGIESQPDGDSWGYSSFGSGIPPESHLQRWIHIAFQISNTKDGIHYMPFYDLKWAGRGSFPRTMGHIVSPLIIGGADPDTAYGGWKRFESMKGYIDEVRVSNGMRYGRGGKIGAKRPLQLDARTIALWQFKEGAGATRYADSSGNGYTLRAGGSLAVEARDKLATTWGRMKRRALEGR